MLNNAMNSANSILQQQYEKQQYAANAMPQEVSPTREMQHLSMRVETYIQHAASAAERLEGIASALLGPALPDPPSAVQTAPVRDGDIGQVNNGLDALGYHLRRIYEAAERLATV